MGGVYFIIILSACFFVVKVETIFLYLSFLYLSYFVKVESSTLVWMLLLIKDMKEEVCKSLKSLM